MLINQRSAFAHAITSDIVAETAELVPAPPGGQSRGAAPAPAWLKPQACGRASEADGASSGLTGAIALASQTRRAHAVSVIARPAAGGPHIR